ncbi:hypothetical protein [Labrys monachus]|uniref:DMSO reductase anchor subunit n=1 Tax=Labrys monachus TaxID=217067 RepID=A0ABU0FI81_9HYPH|nr:hypothetical protein [Labrys monachus]MDQ0394315.1 DMSO reductase anchor subunit [Labrys monachus]
MSKSRWIWIAILAVFAIASAYLMSNPELSSRYMQAQRDAALSADTKEIIMVVIALAIAAYVGWFFLIRRN